ncbi:MAG: amidohydrolase family protein [Betaproteobacteria bacterium]|nr:amidohydrolase family protein [Betaproteobacteria bacterium]
MRTHMKGAQLAVLLGSAASAMLVSATPNIPPPPQREPILITNAALYTISGPVISNGRMLIENGRITAIGDAASVPDKAGAKVISLGGKRVYPGLIVANSSLGLAEIQAVKSTLDTTEVGALNPNARALVAVNPDSELLPVARANGVLAALTVPRASPTGLIAGTSALIQLDGWTWEDMGLIPEVGLHITLPTMRFNPALFPTLMQSRLDEMQRLTTQRLKALDDALEAAAAYAKAKAADANTPVDTRWEAMRPVLSGQRPMFVRADELPQIRYALALAERYNLKLVIIGGMDAWRIADLLRERNVPVIIAGIQRLPMRRGDDTDSVYRLAGQLAKAGVKFAIARSGSEFDAATDRTLPYEAGAAAAHGLARDEALKAITLYPAQILGAADNLGSLETGKLASFFVADGDPLDIRTNIERIFIQGREVELSDRQTKLNDKYQQKYLQLKK